MTNLPDHVDQDDADERSDRFMEVPGANVSRRAFIL